MQQETQEKEPMTQEDIANQREKLTEYYEKTIPFLKLQAEYEDLITQIQEAKTKRVFAQAQIAQFLAPETEENTEEEKPTRPLRKTE